MGQFSSRQSPATPPYVKVCSVCYRRSFKDEDAFRTHCIAFHEYCDQCNEVFDSRALLQLHVRLIHYLHSANQSTGIGLSTGKTRSDTNFRSPISEPKSYHFKQCGFCKVSFENDQALQRHRCLIHTASVASQGDQLVAISPAVSASNAAPQPTAVRTTSIKCIICDVYIEGKELFKKHCVQTHAYCQPCMKPFTTKIGLESHNRAYHHASAIPTTSSLQPIYQKKCKLCARLPPFSTKEEFKRHCTQYHKWCPKCEEPCTMLRTHNLEVHSIRCTTCNMPYVNKNSLQMHINKKHKPASATIHMTPVPRGRTFKCEMCQVSFSSSQELLQHNKSSPRHNWCYACNRGFSTAAGLQSHLSSKAHKTLKHKCPLCPAEFSVPSAVVHHIESGACNNITRHQVTAAVHSLPLVPSISLATRITAPECSMKAEPISAFAAEMAFDGSGYKCWLCPRKFAKLGSLKQHLNSAAHDKAQFKCPKDKCGKKCTLVSGLIQHFESGVCNLATYKEVETYAENMTSRFSSLLLKD